MKFNKILALFLLILFLPVFLQAAIYSAGELGLSLDTEIEKIDWSENERVVELHNFSPKPDVSKKSKKQNVVKHRISAQKNNKKIKKPNIQKSRSKNLRKKEKNLLPELKAKDKRWHYSDYHVKPGDNLLYISRKFQTPTNLIVRANNLPDKNNIKIKQKLIIPNRYGTYHTVRKKDTLIGLANLYEIDINNIVDCNNIQGDKIILGQKLFIPDRQRINKTKNSANVRNSNFVAQKESEKATILLRDNSSLVKAKKMDIESKTKTKIKIIKPLESKTSQQIEQKYQPLKAQTQMVAKRFIWPVQGKITSPFGYRKDPKNGKIKFHCGIDLGVVVGTPIKSAMSGVVAFSGWKNGYGKVVIIKHPGNYLTVYAHNSKNFVAKGQNVRQGEIIAQSGATGRVTGPHVHFEIRKDSAPLNPERLLP